MKDDQPGSATGAPNTIDEPYSRSPWLVRLARAFSKQPKDITQVRDILHAASDTGVLTPDVVAMMDGALDVSEALVRDVMVPRSQMVVLPKTLGSEKLLQRVIESGHSRFPVIGEDKDEIIGILMAKDLLRYVTQPGKEIDLAEILRKAVVISESKRLDALLRDFRSSRNHIAIVVDEYGGVAGLITIEDVLEEIVGEIDDEHDAAEVATIVQLTGSSWKVAALTEIDVFNEKFTTKFSSGDYGTIGGLLLAEFGRLPAVEESVDLERYRFIVTQADSRRLHQLEVQAL